MKKLKRAIKFGLMGLLGLVVLTSVGLLAVYLAAGGAYQVPKTVTEDAAIPHVTIDGVTFHAEAFGDEAAPVVIVIHGGPGNDFRYLLPIKRLADQYRVVFYDQRGTGLSPRVAREALTLDNMIADVARIVDHYGKGERVRLLGHSWGAMLAAGYTARHPEKVSHLLLGEPGMLTSDAAKEFIRQFKFHLDAGGLWALAWRWLQSRHVEPVDEYARDDYFFTSLTTLDAKGGPTAAYYCDGKPPKGTIPAWRYNFASSMEIQHKALADPAHIALDLVKGIERYRGRTLFLCGSCNTMIGATFQKRFHTRFFNGAQLVVVDGAGHNMFAEKPDVSLAVTRAFFKR